MPQEFLLNTGPELETTETSATFQQCEMFGSLLEESPANPQALPAGDEARQMTAGSGRRLLPWLTAFDPHGCCLKTLVESCLLTTDWNSNVSVLRWKVKGTKFNRLLFQLAPLAFRTDATGLGLSPTLTKDGNYNRAGLSKTSGDGLATVLKRMLPTLTRHDTRGGAKQGRTERMWQESARGCDLPAAMRILYPESTGIINPSWAEGYMGYPIGWTELLSSETPLFPKSPTNSSSE